MRTIYIDTDFKCHVTNDGKMTSVETDAFDGKCDTFVEGYRYVPSGETWEREDGVVFQGEMISPWKDYAELASAQKQYEADHKEIEEITSEADAAQTAYSEGVNEA